jgi:two-component system chemotaxis response regulator CheY
MTSLDLVRTLRTDGATEHLQFVLISSITSFSELEPIRQAGATAILPKPFNARELKQVLYSTLDYIRPDAIALADLEVENLNVLIVDDSRMARKKIMHALGNMGDRESHRSRGRTRSPRFN